MRERKRESVCVSESEGQREGERVSVRNGTESSTSENWCLEKIRLSYILRSFLLALNGLAFENDLATCVSLMISFYFVMILLFNEASSRS